MQINEFDYELPKHLIAQTPLQNRSESRLLILDKLTGILEEKKFKNILEYFNEGDCLVLNNTKVMPARLIGVKKETGAIIELLLLKNIEKDLWECMAKPGKRLHIGTIISFQDNLKAIVKNKLEDGNIIVEFIYIGIFLEILEELGTMPLPPYIHEKLTDKNRYQTVYAKEFGSAAAPTAGLHFTHDLLNDLKNKGIKIFYITLHVGIGTFKPIEVLNIMDHKMHSEVYQMDKYVADELNLAKKENRKIYAVGTTSCRMLETIIEKHHEFIPCQADTNIFIYPGFKFKAIDGLITNFHLPKSTLLLLVSALAGQKNIKKAYDYAIKNEFRFFSFGDVMFIK